MSSFYYEGEHSISFINQDWGHYSDFTHKYNENTATLPKSDVIFNGIADGNAHNDRNTWRDWGLIPVSKPVISIPTQQRNKVQVPGASGDVDLTYKLVPWPTFDNRTGSLSFIIDHNRINFEILKSDMYAFLHGQRLRMVLKDDPTYYYEGVFNIESFDPATDGTWTTVNISYDLYPYKRSIYSSVEKWAWDPFNFYTDYALDKIFNKHPISLPAGKTWPGTLPEADDDTRWNDNTINLTGIVGIEPVIPIFTFDSSEHGGTYNLRIGIRYQNSSIKRIETYEVRAEDSQYQHLIKNYSNTDIVFYDSYKKRENNISFCIVAPDTNFNNIEAKVTIDFRKGML